MTNHLAAESIRRALSLRDLTDPMSGPHAIQLLMREITDTLIERWNIPLVIHRAHPVVSVQENYDRLLIPSESVSRDARYTRYLNDHAILRTHSSAMIPLALDSLALDPPPDVLVCCPGVVYRREGIDRQRVGEPHQMDLWRIRTQGPPLGASDLEEMIRVVVGVVGGAEWRCEDVLHPYTLQGKEVMASIGGDWLEIGECGLAAPEVLGASGLQVPPASGLAMGVGLDRLLMLRKSIQDIRLIRSSDPRVSSQMLDLDPYRPVSAMPLVRRDISIAIASETTDDELGDRVRETLGDDVRAVESIEILSTTSYAALPPQARERLGISPSQKNLLLRLIIRHLEKTLTDREANEIRDRVYGAIHEGSVATWALRSDTSSGA